MHTGNAIGLVLGLLGIFLAIGFLALFVGSIVWAYGDAQARGKSGCLVAILVAFLYWPLGLVAWLIFRPDSSKMAGLRMAYIQCQCGSRIRVEERMAGTKVTCASCGTEVLVPELSQLRKILADEGHIER